jgi:hypothetical protein
MRTAVPAAQTAAGSVVMTLGIIAQGVLVHFTGSRTMWDRLWAILVAIVWLYLFSSLYGIANERIF